MYFQSEQLSGLLSLHQNSWDFWINWHLNDWNCVALNRNMTFIKQIKWSIVCFFFWLIHMWIWRESNPRPNKETICFLHVYLCLSFRAAARPKPPTAALSFVFLLPVQGYEQLSQIYPHLCIKSPRGEGIWEMSRPDTLYLDEA